MKKETAFPHIDANFKVHFPTSKSNINMHIANILEDKELSKNSVVNNFLTTAAGQVTTQSYDSSDF